MKSPAFFWMVAAATVTGCEWMGDVIVPGYLINASDTTLVVSVSAPRGRSGMDDGTAERCRLDPTADPIKITSLRAARQKLANEWRPANLSDYDAETCSATMSLPPDAALVMFLNGSCSDYEKYLSNPDFVPSLQRLSITGGGRSIVLTGWDAAKAFKVSSRRKDCSLVIK